MDQLDDIADEEELKAIAEAASAWNARDFGKGVTNPRNPLHFHGFCSRTRFFRILLYFF